MRFRIESPDVTSRIRPTVIPRGRGSAARRSVSEHRTSTSKDGDDGFMNSRNLLHLQHVAGEEGNNKKHNGDEESPCREQLLLCRVALCVMPSSSANLYHISPSHDECYLQDQTPRPPALCSIRQPHVAILVEAVVDIRRSLKPMAARSEATISAALYSVEAEDSRELYAVEGRRKLLREPRRQS